MMDESSEVLRRNLDPVTDMIEDSDRLPCIEDWLDSRGTSREWTDEETMSYIDRRLWSIFESYRTISQSINRDPLAGR